MTFSRIVWNASDDTLNSPRNGLSIAAVRKTKSAMKTDRIDDQAGVKPKILHPKEIGQESIEKSPDQDDGPERGRQTCRNGLQPQPPLFDERVPGAQDLGVGDLFSFLGRFEGHQHVFETVQNRIAVFERDPFLWAGHSVSITVRV